MDEEDEEEEENGHGQEGQEVKRMAVALWESLCHFDLRGELWREKCGEGEKGISRRNSQFRWIWCYFTIIFFSFSLGMLLMLFTTSSF
jgi:hypothetical protein